jgi:hypothetical protein
MSLAIGTRAVSGYECQNTRIHSRPPKAGER